MKVGFIGLGTMGRHMAANLQKAAATSWWSTTYGARRPSRTSRPGPRGPTRRGGRRGERGGLHLAAGADRRRGGRARREERPARRHDRRQGLLRSLDELADGRAPPPRGVQPRGVHMLDAPVSGGPRGAETGKLAHLGRRRRGRLRARPSRCSTRSATSRTTSGPIGAGSVAKLVHNCAGYMHPDGAGRGLHHGREGRRRSAGDLEGRAPRRHRPRAARSTAWPTSSCRASSTRRPSRCAWPTRTCRWPPRSAARSRCRCGSPT